MLRFVGDLRLCGDPSRIIFQFACEDRDQGRFPGAVGSDDPHDLRLMDAPLTGPQVEVTKMLLETTPLQNGLCPLSQPVGVCLECDRLVDADVLFLQEPIQVRIDRLSSGPGRREDAEGSSPPPVDDVRSDRRARPGWQGRVQRR